MHNWRDKGYPNHILVNNVTTSITDFYRYFSIYSFWYEKRFGKSFNKKYEDEFLNFCKDNGMTITQTEALLTYDEAYPDWHNRDYLRVCMANLYEKYKFGVGKNKITESEWNYLILGYKEITGDNYII